MQAQGWQSQSQGYEPGTYYCEMQGRKDAPASHTQAVRERLAAMPPAELRRRADAAERELYKLGITFTVYSERDSIDRILPFDVIPRVFSAADWQIVESGVKQRVAALNLFLDDVYHGQRILKDGIVPAELVLQNANYRPEMQGHDVPHKTYPHVCGIDIVRDERGAFKVLEDNARTPSGVSYVIENRYLMLRTFADLMSGIRVRKIDQYGAKLRHALSEVAPAGIEDPSVVLLSPGVFNSAYFEHVFLAREMGVPLVEGSDLVVDDDRVYMKTTAGRSRVDVIYRRIDDAFLDPEVFRPDSMLGVPGPMRAYRKGKVTLANAVGTGVADDKAVYAYMPRIIEYYLGEAFDLGPMLACQYPDREGRVAAWALQFLDAGRQTETRDLLVRMTRGIKEQLTYQERATHGTQAPAETLALGSGSCRDYALLMMEAARSLGLAARFVSGYLYDPALDGAGPGLQEAGATHAWVQVYLPGAGWVEPDPTNGLVGGANLIRVAVARDPKQAIPLQGSYDGAAEDFIDMRIEVEVGTAAAQAA